MANPPSHVSAIKVTPLCRNEKGEKRERVTSSKSHLLRKCRKENPTWLLFESYLLGKYCARYMADVEKISSSPPFTNNNDKVVESLSQLERKKKETDVRRRCCHFPPQTQA